MCHQLSRERAVFDRTQVLVRTRGVATMFSLSKRHPKIESQTSFLSFISYYSLPIWVQNFTESEMGEVMEQLKGEKNGKDLWGNLYS